jgi:predicted pyridoxine 5'-phosphate oxidase superfamily flavin-nucleotide-binding protein
VLVVAGLSLVQREGGRVAILTEDMKRLVREQGLGFYATVCEDGSPNLSPKGTTRVWDDDHLFSLISARRRR